MIQMMYFDKKLNISICVVLSCSLTNLFLHSRRGTNSFSLAAAVI